MSHCGLRWMRALLGCLLLLPLSACYPSNSVENQALLTEESAKVFTKATRTPAIPATPSATEAFTPTPTQTTIKATKTSMEIAVKETNMPDMYPLTITIVSDNNPFNPRLKSTWGFSALVEYRDHSLLFDTGNDGDILMENMRILGIDPIGIDSIVLSHAHRDHTGGLGVLLGTGIRPTVYLLPSFSASFKNQVSALTEVIEVTPGLAIAEGMFSTGELGKDIPEQALVINTEAGLVIITGCAHPGIVEIVTQARSMMDEPVHLVLGGFHLQSKSQVEIDAILKDFRGLGIEKVAPCHCTGEYAMAMFAAEYGEDFILAGVGKSIELDNRSR
jgi:7,8-dihydropterin-6-yl-methyl-4-(beta-D-ribofuranosyl)aminobenzene 5'-phosphate synthase